MILINLISALLLTQAVEFLTAYIMGYRGEKFYKALGLINVITNPLINYIIHVLYFFKLLNHRIPVVILLEILVVIAEWMLFNYAYSLKGRSFLFLSAVINTSSFLVGILLFG